MTEWGIYSPDCHLFFLFLLGDSPNSEKEHSGFELARLVAQRIPNGHGFSLSLLGDSPNSEKEHSGFELARLVAQRDNTCPAHLILFLILSFDI